jgi:hypothetical protein
MLSKFGVLPAVKVILSATQTRLALSASPICSQHIPHTPTCKYPFIGRYHLYNTVHYIKNHYVDMYKLPLGSIHASVHFLNPVYLLTAIGVCGCPYIGSIILLLRSSTPSQFSHFVYIFFVSFFPVFRQ